MTNDVDPNHPHLQKWLAEGVSIETHTREHKCPCLQKQDMVGAKASYDATVDLMSSIPNMRPVAYRMPCLRLDEFG